MKWVLCGILGFLVLGHIRASAAECKASQIVANPKIVAAALKAQIRNSFIRGTEPQDIHLVKNSIVVKMTSLKLSQNGYGVKGARAQFQVQGITTKGSVIGWRSQNENGKAAPFEVWLVPTFHPDAENEGRNPYCGAYFRYGGYETFLVNVQTNSIFARGYGDSPDAHFNLTTGAVGEGMW